MVHIAFYRFVDLGELGVLKRAHRGKCEELSLKGTILLAAEGINGMLAGDAFAIDSYLEWLETDERFRFMEVKRSETPLQPFNHLFVKIKKEILAFGLEDVKPHEMTAPYVEPQELRRWLEERKDIVLVDVRNNYEIKMGSFEKAINPLTRHFREFPSILEERFGALKDKTIVTYCTGGIRCEKATALMLKRGFKNVFQLHGGALNYFAQTDGKGWRGSCFVFDNRVSLTKGLKQDSKECT